MNRSIRRLGVVLVALFILLAAQLNYLQVIRSDELANHPGNSRNSERDFGQPRGSIVTADGVVVAESKPNADTTSTYTYLRSYPRGELYGHITGFFSYNFGATGIERSYNSMLAGHKVAPTIKGVKDLLIDKTVTADVMLTIDHQVQRTAAQALRQRRGSVVALDVRTGAILASVSYPPYDPNPLASTDFKAAQKAYTRYNADPAKPMLARAYRELYPPGSTFKVVTAATGLDTEVVGTSTPVYPSLSSLPLPRSTRPLRNFGGSTCGGNLVTVFVISCNTSFAQLALDLGPQRLHDGAEAFGFDRKVPLDVSPGAVESFFPPVSFFHLNEPQLAQAGIGQGNVRATPLQMALVAAAIANGGEIKEPHFVKEVRSSEGELVQDETDSTFARAIPADVADELGAMMQSVVTNGTGKRAAIDGVRVAAKTGTAQTGRGTAHAWTIAFAPADAPRVAIAVIIENQPEVSTATGGKIAAPVLRAVLEKALERTR